MTSSCMAWYNIDKLDLEVDFIIWLYHDTLERYGELPKIINTYHDIARRGRLCPSHE